MQSVHKNHSYDRTTYTSGDAFGLKHAKLSPPGAVGNVMSLDRRFGSQITAGFTQTIGNALADHPTADRNAQPDECVESSALRR